MILWNLTSLVGILTGGVVVAFIAKHHFGSKFQFWWLNDTEDGDWGAEWWLRDYGYKKGYWSAINWWFRNHSWNFITSAFTPKWRKGKVDVFREVFRRGVIPTEEYGRFTRADKKTKNYGIKLIAYRIDDVVEFQFSFACKWINVHLGAGGERYRFRMQF